MTKWKKLAAAALCVLLMACMPLLLFGCSTVDELQRQVEEMTRQYEQLLAENERLAGETEQLHGDFAALQDAFMQLAAENTLTQDELIDAEYKFNALVGTDWSGENATYALDRLYIRVGEECLDETFAAEDFLPVEVAEVEQTYRCDTFAEYLLTLHTSDLKELIDDMTKLYSFDFVEEVLLYENVTSEWQLAADRGGYFVSVNSALTDGPLTAGDFAPLSVSEIIPVDGVRVYSLDEGSMPGLTLQIYVIMADGARDEVLEALLGMEIVDYAWENAYDYETRQYPAEEKDLETMELEEWLKCTGSLDLDIDRAYAARLFTIEDFAGFASGETVTWLSYDAFKSGSEEYLHRFRIGTGDDSLRALERDMRIVLRLDFVRSCRADFLATGFPGYPLEDGQ